MTKLPSKKKHRRRMLARGNLRHTFKKNIFTPECDVYLAKFTGKN
jgi:hypothetical protein